MDAKIRVIAVAKSEGVSEALEKAAKEKIGEWQKKHQIEIRKLKDAARSEFYKIWNQSKLPEQIGIIMPSNIIVPCGKETLDLHLYASTDGCPTSVFDSDWEKEVVEKELDKDTIVAWYRNPRGGDNAIVVPYEEDGEIKPMHPDLIFIHSVDGEYVVDLVDPHGPQYSDTSPKWVGLARYAKKHSSSYRSVKAVIKEGDNLRTLDLMDEEIANEVARANNETAIRKLFKRAGTDYS